MHAVNGYFNCISIHPCIYRTDRESRHNTSRRHPILRTDRLHTPAVARMVKSAQLDGGGECTANKLPGPTTVRAVAIQAVAIQSSMRNNDPYLLPRQYGLSI